MEEQNINIPLQVVDTVGPVNILKPSNLCPRRDAITHENIDSVIEEDPNTLYAQLDGFPKSDCYSLNALNTWLAGNNTVPTSRHEFTQDEKDRLLAISNNYRDMADNQDERRVRRRVDNEDEEEDDLFDGEYVPSPEF